MPRLLCKSLNAKGTKALAAFWGALAALMLAGCERVDGAQDHVSLRFGLASEPVTLDPRFATDAASSRINRLIYERLVDFDARLSPQPALATWTRLDPLRYRFTLRGEDRRFHDGSRLGAADVKATYDSVLDPKIGSPHRGSLEMVHAIEVVDEHTVDFVLSRPDALLPGRLTVGILPAARIEAGHRFNREPLGSGPFRLARWPKAAGPVIERLDDGLTVQFVRVASPTVRVLKLLRDELDIIQGDIPPELLAWIDAGDRARVLRAPGTSFAYLGFNVTDPVVGDMRVRRAIAHALDREAIIRHLLGGAARPANAILDGAHWAGNPDLEPIAHDPSAARALLASAGFADTPARIVYKTSSDPFRLRLATVIQEQLARVGVEVELRSYDWGTFYGDVRAGRFQMYSLAWVGVKMPDIFRYTMHSGSVPPDGANRGRFASERVDALIEAAERAPTLDEQARAYRELQAALHADLPYVPLWFEDQVCVIGEGLSAYTLSADGSFDGLRTVQRESDS